MRQFSSVRRTSGDLSDTLPDQQRGTTLRFLVKRRHFRNVPVTELAPNAVDYAFTEQSNPPNFLAGTLIWWTLTTLEGCREILRK